MQQKGEREIIWVSADGGLEHLCLDAHSDGNTADSLVLGAAGKPFRLHYQLTTDGGWRVLNLGLRLLAGRKRLNLRADGRGGWQDGRGRPLPALQGCLDVDISVTPFTNTLPIRRLRLTPGQTEQITVAYIRVPDLSVQPMQQRYTCLSADAAGSVYRYESVDSGYVADLQVDAGGIVVDYPNVWRKVWP